MDAQILWKRTDPRVHSERGRSSRCRCETRVARGIYPLRDRLAQSREVADGEQVLWFLERIGPDRKFLGRMRRFVAGERATD
jgi:hypothetical protein